MSYLDNFIINSLIAICENVGSLFLADYIGINSFWLGFYILAILTGISASLMIPGGKKHVR